MSDEEFENMLERIQVLESDLDEVYERLDKLESPESDEEDEVPDEEE